MQRDLRNLVMMTGTVQLINHSGNIVNVNYETLVPGDIILIPENESTMLCDAILLTGNVIVNESMLTGESVAFTKTPISTEDSIFNIKSEARSILFNGTKVLQTRSLHGEPVRAMVLRTGFMTLKGELIQSILFPKPIDFKFNKHTYKFIGVLALIAMLGFFYTLGLMILSHKADPATIAIRALDLITITVSPALPISMAVGVIFAQRRLKKLGVFCISPKTINIVAALNLVCFDKTGTITMEDLDMLGVVPIDRDDHFESCQDIIGLAFSPLLKCLVTCQSLTKLDGKFIGDPLDIKMFNATHWVMRDSYEITDASFNYDVVAEFLKPPAAKTLEKMPKLGIIRQFPFTSAAQSMSVIVTQQNNSDIEFYIKGSPEKLSSLCIPESMPDNYMEELFHYTQQGYRVIALAWKSLGNEYAPEEIKEIKRSQLERDLIFLGFMILENRPKPDSRQVIQLLQDANIRTVMITGDNIYTAVCVAKDVDMIQQNEKIIMVEAVEPRISMGNTLKVNTGSQPGKNLKLNLNTTGLTRTTPTLQKPSPTGTSPVGSPTSLAPVSRPVIMYRYAESGHFYSQSVEKRRSSVYMPRSKEELESLQMASKMDAKRRITNRYHFALNGKTLKAIQTWHPYLLPKILSRGTIFARMSPEQKAQLIESFQSLGYYVGMCGDGANDCGALKMAHAGISLSENESSIASPFTSKTQSITCVPLLLREGRAALTTSFGIFKYLASYSMVQFVSVTILYWVKASLTDFEYLYVDLFEMMFLAITFGRTLAYPYLSKERPPLSLISFLPIFSIISCLIINICAQLTVFILVSKQPWFEPLKPTHSKDYYSYQNACVFSLSNFQYIVLAVIFSKGPPFRMPTYTNYMFCAAVFILTTISAYILLYGHPKFLAFLQYRAVPDMRFRWIVLLIAAINCLLLVINEKFFVQIVLKNTVQKQITKRKSSKYPYQRLEREMDALDPDSIVNIGLEPSDHCIDLGVEEKGYGYAFEGDDMGGTAPHKKSASGTPTSKSPPKRWSQPQVQLIQKLSASGMSPMKATGPRSSTSNTTSGPTVGGSLSKLDLGRTTTGYNGDRGNRQDVPTPPASAVASYPQSPTTTTIGPGGDTDRWRHKVRPHSGRDKFGQDRTEKGLSTTTLVNDEEPKNEWAASNKGNNVVGAIQNVSEIKKMLPPDIRLEYIDDTGGGHEIASEDFIVPPKRNDKDSHTNVYKSQENVGVGVSEEIGGGDSNRNNNNSNALANTEEPIRAYITNSGNKRLAIQNKMMFAAANAINRKKWGCKELDYVTQNERFTSKMIPVSTVILSYDNRKSGQKFGSQLYNEALPLTSTTILTSCQDAKGNGTVKTELLSSQQNFL